MDTLNGFVIRTIPLDILRDWRHQDEVFSELCGWLIMLGIVLWVLWHALKEHRRG